MELFLVTAEKQNKNTNSLTRIWKAWPERPLGHFPQAFSDFVVYFFLAHSSKYLQWNDQNITET
jgi:hypothetical protein